MSVEASMVPVPEAVSVADLRRAVPAANDRPAHVLIADDEPKNRALLEVMLVEEHYSIEIASSGAEALAIVARQPQPDLVLLDVMMPDGNGYEVAKAIKGNPTTKNIPIIIVTALEDQEARLLGLGAGAEDFLTRPIERAELRVRVRNLLRLKACADFHEKHTERLEAEVSLRTHDLAESERLYRSTFDAAPIGIAQLNLDGRCVRVNARLCELLGYAREELLGLPVQGLLLPEDVEAVARALHKLAAGTLDRHVVEERHYRRGDGRLVWARVGTSVHRNATGQAEFFISVFEDVTMRRALEAQVRQANKMDAVGQLASGIAHDFNNLLSVILSYGELLVADLKEGDPMRAELNEITSAGVRAAGLTRQLLAFSRQQVLAPRLVSLAEIIAGMEKLLQRLIGADVSLTTRVDSIGQIMADPGQIEQVIMNLAVNARDAMPSGGRLTIEASEVVLDEAYAKTHEGGTPGAHVMLALSDTGTGMDQATQAHMFEPFFTTKDVGKGTGMGLATVFGIVRQSGGTIGFRSEVGRGTTFKIYFPRLDGRADPAPATPLDVGSLHGSETILVVEDEERVRLVVCAVLRKYGYNVLDAPSGGDAFLQCEQFREPIHLLLTDIVMPRMGGGQLADRLLAVRPLMKVLYMSGYANAAAIRRGIMDSSMEFVQKPITPGVLAHKVRAILDSAVRA